MKLLSVNFHYIRDEIYLNGIYPRSLHQLSAQIDELSKYYEFISQNDLIHIIKNKIFIDKNYCLITFDDGLKEQMSAFELLNKKGIPAVFYVTTKPIRSNKVVSVHKLHYIRSVMKDEEIFQFINHNINLKTIQYPDNIGKLYRYDSLQVKKIKYLLNFLLDIDTKDKLIDDLFSTIADESDFAKKLYMSIEDIRSLSDIGYLGTHGDSHLPLATLDECGIEKDIQTSIDFLHNSCNGGQIKSISYPYGGPKAVSEKVINVLGKFGFIFGLTMFRGLNDIKDFDCPMLLKRVDTNDAPGGKLNSREFCL